MVKQYPDNIKIIYGSAPVQIDGHWTKPEQSVFNGKCRVEINLKGVFRSETGENVKFDYLVFMPSTRMIFPFGADVEIEKHDGSLITSTVKGCSNGQLNSEVWL